MKKQLFPLLAFSYLLLTLTPCLTHAQTIAAGGEFSLSICADNTVRACGYNMNGQLGDSTNTIKTTPVQVNGLSNVKAVAAGNSHSLFVKNDGTVWVCGYNQYGQLGNGTNVSRWVPVQVSNLSGVVAAAGGLNHSLFVKSDSTAWACGANTYGQLGDGTNTAKDIPVQVSGLTGVVAVAAGRDFSLFLKADGTVWACGNNYNGPYGDSTDVSRNVPVIAGHGLNNVVAISAGTGHSLFLRADSTAWACGYGGSGQLGNAFIGYSYVPVQVIGGANFTAVAAGTNQSVFAKSDGTAWACGYLGNPESTPIQVAGLSGIVAVATSSTTTTKYHSLFLKNDGSIHGWGDNYYGQLGNNSGSGVTVQMNNTCSPTAINDVIPENNGKLIFTNPAADMLWVAFTSENQNECLEIYGLNGQLLLKQPLQSNSGQYQAAVKVSELSAGMYILKAGNRTEKLVIE